MDEDIGFLAHHVNKFGRKPPKYRVTFVTQCRACKQAMIPGQFGSYAVWHHPNVALHWECLKIMTGYRELVRSEPS